MKFSGWRGLVGLLIPVAFFLGCTVPPSAARPATERDGSPADPG